MIWARVKYRNKVYMVFAMDQALLQVLCKF